LSVLRNVEADMWITLQRILKYYSLRKWIIRFGIRRQVTMNKLMTHRFPYKEENLFPLRAIVAFRRNFLLQEILFRHSILRYWFMCRYRIS